jgi:hypothetical protein
MVTGGDLTESEEDLLIAQVVMTIWRTGDCRITVQENKPENPERGRDEHGPDC